MEGQEGERTAPQGPLTLGGLEGPVDTSAYPWEDRCLEVEKEDMLWVWRKDCIRKADFF